MSASMRQSGAAVRTPAVEASDGSPPRALSEWLVLLAIAVSVFRAYALEGYMISTGSMAPCLLGYHRQVRCPSCGIVFAHGAAESSEVEMGGMARDTTAASASESGHIEERLTCPNCGRTALAFESLPRTEGDQLLVFKHAYVWRRLLQHQGPRRWEVAVFRNPADATLPYVKRLVGLPGERVELIDGDVYADGKLQRKPLAAQLGARLPVTLNDFRAGDNDPDWQARWRVDDAASSWQADGSRFLFDGARPGGAAGAVPQELSRTPLERVSYQHWIRRGGTHRTLVELEKWPAGLDLPNPLLSPLEYDAEEHRLSYYGALINAQWERWDAASEDVALKKALAELYFRSHVAPITSASVYNRDPGGGGGDEEYPVRDLMVELALHWSGGAGEFVLEMTDGDHDFRCEVDFGRDELRLTADDRSEPLRVAKLPAAIRQSGTTLLMSTFDRQVLVACDGSPAFAPLPYEREEDGLRELRRPVRFGARGVRLAVDHVALYRDVYYTPVAASGRNVYDLGADEYFALGDNSAVSVDSRRWENCGVKEELLIGKPLVVHLPSRPGEVTWGGRTRQIRVPDFSRIRYIR